MTIGSGPKGPYAALEACEVELADCRRLLAENTAAMLDAEERARNLGEALLEVVAEVQKLRRQIEQSVFEVGKVEKSEHAEKACCQVAGPISMGEREG